jgi:hypothetical protein
MLTPRFEGAPPPTSYTLEYSDSPGAWRPIYTDNEACMVELGGLEAVPPPPPGSVVSLRVRCEPLRVRPAYSPAVHVVVGAFVFYAASLFLSSLLSLLALSLLLLWLNGAAPLQPRVT